eukprot:6628408-Prymnesium_polylepis.1
MARTVTGTRILPKRRGSRQSPSSASDVIMRAAAVFERADLPVVRGPTRRRTGALCNVYN